MSGHRVHQARGAVSDGEGAPNLGAQVESVEGRNKANGQGSGAAVSGAKGLLVIVGAMVGFMALLAVVATVLTS